jgi:transposase-like protein
VTIWSPQHITRPRCDSSTDIVKNGLAPTGKQKYLRHACVRQSREAPLPTATVRSAAEEILCAYQERSSLRGLRAASETSYRRGRCFTSLLEAKVLVEEYGRVLVEEYGSHYNHERPHSSLYIVP